MKKLLYSDVKNYIEKNNCILISTTYHNQKELLTIQCSCGNIFKRSFKLFKINNKICNECSMLEQKKKTSSSLKKLNNISKKLCSSCNNEYTDNTICSTCIKKEKNNIKLNNIKNIIKNKNIKLLSNEYINTFTKYIFICKCNQKFERNWNNMYHQNSYYCNQCMNQISKQENEIIDLLYLIDSNINIIKNSKDLIPPKEIDIFIPDKKIAIEFNGTLWHSEQKGRDRKYHLNKTEKIEEKDIKLFHIFEYEWINPIKNKIWKSMLSHAMGKSNKIFARKCIIKEVNNIESKIFLESNHLQGYSYANINIGLYLEDTLISLMTFGKPRFNKNYQWELIRFVTKIEYTVIGGASKILKYFERTYKPKSLISYANRRWSNGNLYYKLGFTCINKSLPNYFYFHTSNSKIVYSRNKFQKHKLSKLLNKFDSGLTEYQNMLNHGYDRIWDSGNLVFIKEF